MVSRVKQGNARYTDREDGCRDRRLRATSTAWDWVIVAQESTDTTLAPVAAQRNRALVLILVGTLLAIVFAVLFAWRITRPVRALTGVAGEAAGWSVGRACGAGWVDGAGGAGVVVQLDARDV